MYYFVSILVFLLQWAVNNRFDIFHHVLATLVLKLVAMPANVFKFLIIFELLQAVANIHIYNNKEFKKYKSFK